MTRRYFVRTFGCQMNEHDSERIAGLLEADGLVAAESADDADVVVLNTCCIRENADNKLYGTLGHLKSTKDAKPGMQIVVAGCLAQKDNERVRERAPYVDVVFGTHNVGRAAELLARPPGTGPVTEILDGSDEFPSALPAVRDVAYSAWVTIQVGCDNSCAFCIVPSVRGKEISRPIEASRGRGRRAGGQRRHRGHAARPERQFLRPRHHPARPAVRASCSAPSATVDGIRRVRFTSPHPKDLRPEVIAAMAETPAVCPHLHLPLQSGSDRVLAAMHRGYTADALSRAPRRGPRRDTATSPSRPTSSSAFPARPRTTSRRRSRWPRRPRTTAPTRSSSRRRTEPRPPR